MKIAQSLLLATTLASTSAIHAAVTFDFTGNGSFDGQTSLLIPLTDSDTGFSTTMTLTAGGGTFNSNSGDFGIDSGSGTNDYIDGTSESITITFGHDIEFNAIDLGGVEVGDGSGLDAASLTIGGSTIILQTGVTDFNGSTDVFTPASSISLLKGQSIILTGADSTSVIDLEAIDVSVVPEPGTAALIAGFFAMASIMFRRRAVK